MNRGALSDGEWKLMNLLWDVSPRTIGALVDALKADTGWTTATVNIMLTRLADKNAVRIDASGRVKRFYPLLGREEAVRQEAKNTLARIRTGGIGLLLSAMASECDMSDDEVDELYRLLKKGRHYHE